MERKSYSFNNYGRNGEGCVDLNSEEAKKNRQKLIDGSEEYQAGKEASEFMKTLEGGAPEKMSFRALYEAFSSDLEIIRKMIVKYDNLEDAQLKSISGEEILSESEKIKSEIAHQVEASGDPYEKGEFDNLRVELEKITRNVEGLPDLKTVNG